MARPYYKPFIHGSSLLHGVFIREIEPDQKNERFSRHAFPNKAIRELLRILGKYEGYSVLLIADAATYWPQSAYPLLRNQNARQEAVLVSHHGINYIWNFCFCSVICQRLFYELGHLL